MGLIFVDKVLYPCGSIFLIIPWKDLHVRTLNLSLETGKTFMYFKSIQTSTLPTKNLMNDKLVEEPGSRHIDKFPRSTARFLTLEKMRMGPHLT